MSYLKYITILCLVILLSFFDKNLQPTEAKCDRGTCALLKALDGIPADDMANFLKFQQKKPGLQRLVIETNSGKKNIHINQGVTRERIQELAFKGKQIQTTLASKIGVTADEFAEMGFKYNTQNISLKLDRNKFLGLFPENPKHLKVETKNIFGKEMDMKELKALPDDVFIDAVYNDFHKAVATGAEPSLLSLLD